MNKLVYISNIYHEEWSHWWVNGNEHIPEFCETCREGRPYIIEPMTRIAYPELSKRFDRINEITAKNE